MEVKQLGRRAELESMFNKFPHVPREPILQIDLYREGTTFTDSALRVLEPFATKTYNLFIWDRVAADSRLSKIPDQIHITGGIYGLRGNVNVDWHINPESGYIVDIIDGKLTLCSRENDQHIPIAPILDPYPRPKHKDKHFEDGTGYGEVVDTVAGKPFTRLVPTRMCHLWGYNEQCLFCDINVAAKGQTKVGLRSKRGWFEKPEQVAEVFKEIYLREEWPIGKLPNNILITGGTILSKLDGLSEDDFYLRYVEAIREAIGYRQRICLQTGPKTREVAKRYRDAGVDVHETNLEVWDERIFNILCPGKAKRVGWKKWVDMMCDEVDIFGLGNVSPCFVCGTEMAEPFGFKTIDEAVESTLSGWDYLMAHGVVPRPREWTVEAGSALAGQKSPPLEYLIRVFYGWYELWKKYSLPPMRRYDIMGPGREQADRGWASMGS